MSDKPKQTYDFTDTLKDLEAGVFAKQLSYAVHQSAIAARNMPGKKAKVVVTLELSAIGDGPELNFGHALSWDKPTQTGKVIEHASTRSVVWVSTSGLSYTPDTQENFDFTGRNERPQPKE